MIFSQNSSSRGCRGGSRTAPTPNLVDGLLAGVVGLVSLALYLRTLAPGLLPGDSGEFQTLAYLLGNTHPTGYAVYLLLAKPFTWLPVGDIAYRLNLFSAVTAALAVGGTYLAGRLLGGQPWAALVGALALAVCPAFWSQALIAEVYTPGALFLVAILLMLLLWDATGKPRYLFLAGLLGGLSLGVHLTVALLAPAVAVFVLTTRPPKSILVALLGALLGAALALVAFLLLDLNHPTANYFDSVVGPSRSAWDLAAADLDGGFDRLFFGLSARQFRPYMFADPVQVMPRQARDYFADLPAQFTPLILFLTVLGALGLLVRLRRQAGLLLVALASQWLYTFNYEIWDLYVFHIPGYVLLCWLAAAGAGVLAGGWHALARQWRGRRIVEALLAIAVLAVGVWPILAQRWEAVQAGHVPFADSDEYPVGRFSQATLHPLVSATVAGLEPNAILFTDWDLLYPYYYAAHIEQGRTDLLFVETYPRDDVPVLADSVLEFVAAQAGQCPIYVSERLPELTAAGYRLRPARVGPTRLYSVQPGEQGANG